MKKIVLIIFLLSSILFADKSPYPLPITFNDMGYVPTNISFRKDKKSWNFSMLNDKDNSMWYANKIYFFHCDNVLTYQDFISMTKNKKCKCNKGFNMFKPKIDSTLNINNLKILVYKTKTYYSAYIFYKNKFLGQLGFSGNGDDFYTILKSLSINKEIKPIDFYIKKAHKQMDNVYANTLCKYTFSALILNPKDKRIKPLIKRIVKVRNVGTDIIKALGDIQQ